MVMPTHSESSSPLTFKSSRSTRRSDDTRPGFLSKRNTSCLKLVSPLACLYIPSVYHARDYFRKLADGGSYHHRHQIHFYSTIARYRPDHFGECFLALTVHSLFLQSLDVMCLVLRTVFSTDLSLPFFRSYLTLLPLSSSSNFLLKHSKVIAQQKTSYARTYSLPPPCKT